MRVSPWLIAVVAMVIDNSSSVWIVEALTSGNPSSVSYIVEKLKSVPITPPPDVIRNICVLLVQEMREIQAISGKKKKQNANNKLGYH